jgi:nucleoside-diphosphate-sugar epimerase
MLLVTGSAGHLGEALLRDAQAKGIPARGLDQKASAYTDLVGDIADPSLLERAFEAVTQVIHTATLHKPHVVTHSRQAFVHTNIEGTLALLEKAAETGVSAFVHISTTSVFGRAMRPKAGDPAVWVTEALSPVHKNIYGVTKSAGEDLCQLMHERTGLPVLVLRTSRFFPEMDDDEARRGAMPDAALKILEFLHRRVAIEDIVTAVHQALERAPKLGFDRYIISAPTPFEEGDAYRVASDLPALLQEKAPEMAAAFQRAGWPLPPGLDRVYDSRKAQQALAWAPTQSAEAALKRFEESGDWRGPLALAVGKKPYHDQTFEDGPFPVEADR